MTDIKHLIAANRAAVAEVLAALPEERWDEPTLCAGWRAREVVAHITMPFRYSGPRFLAELARNRFRFTAMSDRVARRDATALPPAALVRALADNAGHPWKPPGGGLAGALTHDTIHGLDITVPLRLGYVVAPSVWEIVLPGLAEPRTVRYFGTDLTGVTLQASDLDWSYGSGPSVVTGTAADLALLMCGRKLPPWHLEGERSDRFTAPTVAG
jgi:uncharacterized protein (TIGR03083 family)